MVLPLCAAAYRTVTPICHEFRSGEGGESRYFQESPLLPRNFSGVTDRIKPLPKVEAKIVYNFVPHPHPAIFFSSRGWTSLCRGLDGKSKNGLDYFQCFPFPRSHEGIIKGDEIMVINGAIVSDLDMMFIESVLQEEISLCMMMRSSRTGKESFFKYIGDDSSSVEIASIIAVSFISHRAS